MNSFYGGKQGRTYHIVARYDSVSDMVKAFKNGGAYTEVNYGQYVLIDTVLNRNNRSERENGLLYRRGFNYIQDYVIPPTKTENQTDQDFYKRWRQWVQHPGGGAIYIGQIVGPEGRTPEVSLEDWETFLNQPANQTSGNETFGSKSAIVVNDYSSGKSDKEIQVGYINIKTAEGDVEGGYLSMNIPKLEIEAVLDSADPYATASIEEKEGSEDSIGFPFWYKWHFTIPSGKHGQDIQDIKIETGSETEEKKDAFGEDIVADDQYFTYSIKKYDTEQAPVTEHLGRWPYRVIKNITSQNSKDGKQSGMLLQSWSSGIQVQEAALLDNLGLDSFGNRIVAICTKAGTTGTEQPNFISKLNQTISDGSPNNSVSWLVTTLPASAPADTLQVNYTAGNSNTFDYRQIEYTFVNDIGQMFVVYSDQPDNAYYITEVLSLKDVSFDPNSGWLTVYYNNNKSTSLGIPAIQNISFPSENIDAVQKFKLTYKSSYEPLNPISQDEKHSIYISEEFDRIIDIRLNGDDVVILHSSPTVRNSIPNEKKVSLPYNGENYDWQNLGPLGGQYHIQGEYSYSNLLGIEGYTPDLSNGFTGNLQDRAGWIVTVTDGNTKHIYAYDYNHTEGEKKYRINNTPTNWYQIMTINQAVFDPTYSVFIGETNQNNNLNQGGIWFELSEGHTPHSN